MGAGDALHRPDAGRVARGGIATRADAEGDLGASAHAAQAADEARPGHLRPARRVGGAGGRKPTLSDAGLQRRPGERAGPSRRAHSPLLSHTDRSDGSEPLRGPVSPRAGCGTACRAAAQLHTVSAHPTF